jgi:DnaD and phage-associated domain
MYDNLSKKIVKMMKLDRGLSKAEQRYIVEWKETYDMKDDIVLEAVKRAVAYKGERVSFAYINAIIESWSSKGVKNFSDIIAIDDVFRKKKENKKDNPDKEVKKEPDVEMTGGVTVKLERITDTARIPTKSSSYAAGYDLYADIQTAVTVRPREVVKVGTGLKMAVPDGYFGAIFARNGLAADEQLVPVNGVGICSGHSDEYIVTLINNGNADRTVYPGERIAQLVILPYLPVMFVEGKIG